MTVAGATPAILSAAQKSTPAARRSVIALVRFRDKGRVLRSHGVSRYMLRRMLRSGIMQIAQTRSIEGAISKLFSPKDIIALKFDALTDYMLGTNQALAEELFRLFLGHGFSGEQLLFIGTKPQDNTIKQLPGKVPFGWTKQMDFGSGSDQFAAVLNKVTAIVNVPTLRADAVTGISGCLKNVTFALMRHPARFYANGGAPAIADIYSLPMIGKKVRLNIVNSLKVLIRDDRVEAEDAVVRHESLLFSLDPVATDSVAFEIIEQLRAKNSLGSLLKEGDFPRQLVVAAKKGLGRHHPDQIDIKPIILE